MPEEWREVLPGIEVSSEGRARQYLNGHADRDGYLCISGGKRGARRWPLHSLVALAFLGPRPSGHVVRHLNDIVTDNSVRNLGYGTRKQNYADALNNGRVNPRCPIRLARLKAVARLGGLWWKGKKRAGLRGKAVA